ncbi:hypothetical protein HDU91_006978 [Kappamyces sp. JEL0680]|nr:hypothetical protein HDU91_006978 [Kappamyces sp. JEL0680]
MYLFQSSQKKTLPFSLTRFAALTKVALSPGDMAMQDFAGITTLTYYATPLHAATLRQRVASIILQNPWLAARFVTNEEGKVDAVYPTSLTSAELDLVIESHFGEVDSPTLRNGLGFEASSALLRDHLVKKGKNCVDKDVPLFKVLLITTGAQKENMLLFSLSHTLGDGFTFYKLYSMMETPISPMIFDRVPTFVEDSKAVLGSDLNNFLMNPFTIFGFIYNVIGAKEYPNLDLAIDQSLVNAAKAGVEKDLSFLSTNDVITSWVINFSGCSYGMMALNMRNRVKSVTDAHAGNYEGSLLFKPPITPSNIRKAIVSMKVSELPSYFDGMWGNSVVISNWSSFHHELVIEGNAPVNHHPLEGEKVFLVKSTAIIYKPTASRLSLIYGDCNPSAKASQPNLFLN